MAIDPVGEICAHGMEIARISVAPISIQLLFGAPEMGQVIGILVNAACFGHNHVGTSLGEGRP